MTLRQYLDSRTRRDKRIALAVFIASGVVWLFASVYAWAGPAAFAVLLVIMHIRATAIPCPRCKASLGRLGYRYFAAVTGRARGYYMQRAEEAAQCPHCALGLDQEISSPAT